MSPTPLPSSYDKPPTVAKRIDPLIPECVDIEAEEVGHEGVLGELNESPIEVIGVDVDSYVVFKIKQSIIEGRADHFSVMYECMCIRFDNASIEDSYPELIGECKNGEATVSLYLEDASLQPGDDVEAPSICNPFNEDPPHTKRVAYHFRIPCNTVCIRQGEFADPPATPKPSPTAVSTTRTSTEESTCDESVVVEYQDFESSSYGTWKNGIISYDPVLTKFLGRLNKENNHVDNTFFVSSKASSVTVEFIMYEIDQWDSNDGFIVTVNSNRVDLGQFYEEDQTENMMNYESGSKGGISWLRYSITPAMDVAYNSAYADQAHKVELLIPPSYYADGTLDIELRVNMLKSIENESAGIDNFKVTAHGLCFSRDLALSDGLVLPLKAGPNRLLDENYMLYDQASQITNKKAGKEGETPHCSLKEFPCEDKQKVHICHYNPHIGYQTFCVSEDESDIVQFYANSYCGPCVGSFGGRWFHL